MAFVELDRAVEMAAAVFPARLTRLQQLSYAHGGNFNEAVP
ncbi:hypothetical protein ACSMXN_05290 [Jatrophihabitans sp. DSM 45814]